MKSTLILFSIIVLCVVSNAVDVRDETGGNCGEITWTYDSSDDSLTLSGSGDMEQCSSFGHYPWDKYGLSVKSVVIGEGITSIGQQSFQDCYFLSSVTIPSTVESIGDYAFYQCVKLKKISIPEGCQSVGIGAFSGTLLNEVTLPETNPYLAFVDDVLFDKEFTKLIFCLPSKSGDYEIPGTVTTIYPYAFYMCDKLTNLVLPSQLERIELNTFYHCRALESVVIPKSVTFIGNNSFSGCSALQSVSIPRDVDTIQSGAFEGLSSLKAFEVDAGNQFFKVLGESLFDFSGTSLIQVPAGLEGTFVTPESTASIMERAFYDCRFLTSVVLPENLQRIEQYTFFGCADLISVRIPPAVEFIGNRAFYQCSSLESVVISASVSEIEDKAFDGCVALNSVIYLGTTDPSPDYKLFRNSVDLSFVCVPSEYQDASLGNRSFCKSSSCESILAQENQCYERMCSEGVWSIKVRDNVTVWEQQSNGCQQNICLNETGPYSWSLCNSTDELTRMCVNDECVDDPWMSVNSETRIIVNNFWMFITMVFIVLVYVL